MPVIEHVHLPICRITEVSGDSVGRDARFHLMFAVLGSVVVLINQQLAFQFSFFLLLIVALMWWRVPVVKIAHSLIPVLVMMTLTIVYHLLFFDLTRANYGARPILYSPALDFGLFYAFRLGGLYLLIVQLVRVVEADALSDAFISVIWPSRSIGLPVVPLVLALRAGLSSIPGLTRTMREFEQSLIVSDAKNGMRQASLFGRFGRPSRPGRLRFFSKLFTPLLVAVVRRADQLVLAIRVRGYQPGKPMTRFSTLLWRRRDSLESLAFVVIVAIIWRWAE